jgi:hypothetical protein
MKTEIVAPGGEEIQTLEHLLMVCKEAHEDPPTLRKLLRQNITAFHQATQRLIGARRKVRTLQSRVVLLEGSIEGLLMGVFNNATIVAIEKSTGDRIVIEDLYWFEENFVRSFNDPNYTFEITHGSSEI